MIVRHGDPDTASTRELLNTIMPRTVLDIGGNYVTGRDLDDPGGGWRDGLAAHTALQIGHLAERGHTHIAMAFGGPKESFGGAGLSEVRRRFARETAKKLGLPPLRELTLTAPREAGTAAVGAFLATPLRWAPEATRPRSASTRPRADPGVQLDVRQHRIDATQQWPVSW